LFLLPQAWVILFFLPQVLFILFLLPQGWFILFAPFGLLAPTDLNIIFFLIF
jgi:hypothetical protein